MSFNRTMSAPIWSGIFIGLGVLAVALLAPELGLGRQENFLLYRVAGITRRSLGFFALLPILCAIVIAILPEIQRHTKRPLSGILPPWEHTWKVISSARHLPMADLAFSRGDRGIPRNLLALAAAIIAILIFFLVLWALPDHKAGSQTLFIREQTRLYNFVGSYDQRSAHFSALIATALFCTIGFFIGRRGYVSSRSWEPSISIWPCFVAALILCFGLSRIVTGGEVGAAFLFAPVLLLSAAFHSVIERRLGRWLTLCIGVYSICIILPGLLTDQIPLLADGGEVLAQLELHSSAMTMPGVGISAGQNFFSGVPYNYGLLMQSLISIIDLKYGAMSIGDQLHFVQACQILFALLAVASYLYYRPHHYLGALVALLLAGPYWSSVGLGIWHPNQTGFRSLGLPLGMFALITLGRYQPPGWQWLLGAVGGVAILINPETAVALGVGYFIYFLLAEQRLPVAAIARMATAVVGIFALYFLMYRIALGRLPFGGDLVDIVQTLQRHTSGDFGARLFAADPSGENFYLVPFVLVMFAHAIAVLVASFTSRGKGPLDHENALRCSAAVTLIVWLSYYFTFPNWWQIWTHLFLYGFLVIDLFDNGNRNAIENGTGLSRSLPRGHIRIGSAIVVLLLAFMIPKTNIRLVQTTHDFINPPWLGNGANATVVSGVLMPADMGIVMRAKATKLKELYEAHNGRVIYLTFNSAFIPTMSRIFEPMPERDPFNNIDGETGFAPAMERIMASRPDIILIDSPTGPLAVNGPRKEFQDRVREAIERDYRKSAVDSGWELWIPKSQS